MLLLKVVSDKFWLSCTDLSRASDFLLLEPTIRHLLQVFEDAQVVSQVGRQNNVSDQIQHPLVVLKCSTTTEAIRPVNTHTHTLITCQCLASDLPGELLKDVAADGVQDGDGLSKVVSLRVKQQRRVR